ncbi:hypothetical protein ACQEVB_28595 [Pseudonocardia sp. CA-107938]|uniref:hypothetical protein n=1 Tax=Pseudonocardia sp. CA-107938 TaxID=3240021 RepID=UPI003D8D2418
MFGELLRDLIADTGAQYCCVADAAQGRVLEEVGVQPGAQADTSLAVLGWGAGAAAFLASNADDEMDDLIITTRSCYHLVRPLATASGEESLLVYLRVDRHRGNLAVARRGLSTARPRAPTVPKQDRAESAPALVAAGRVPLPRRHPVALPAPRRPLPTPAPSTIGVRPEGGRWHTDVDTLDRLLHALRRLR